MNANFFEMPEEKQAAIVNGALKLFASMGYRKASMQDIATECGVSKSLLFHYFGSKKDLFAYIHRHSSELMEKSLGAFQYRKDEDLFEMILRSNTIKLELFKSYPYLYKFVYKTYFEEDAGVQDIVREKSAEHIAQAMPDVVLNMDKTRLREGISPERALQLILWVSEGFLQQKLDEGGCGPDRLLTDFNGWMDTLRVCLYKT